MDNNNFDSQKKEDKVMMHDLKIGVLGGGQLGRMLAQEAVSWNLRLFFMDKASDYPVPKVFAGFSQGDITSYEDVMRFGSDKQILTIEIENVNSKALLELQRQGVKVIPQPEVLTIIQDKGLQKNFYDKNGIPTSQYQLVEGNEEILNKVEDQSIQFPFVQKTRKAGYDGKGVAVINNRDDLSKLLSGPSVIESLVDIEKELAVIVAKTASGDLTTLPATEMVFDTRGNLLDYLICPAEINTSQETKCTQIAKEIITKLDMAGILAVEFFLTRSGEILVNEVAPRPHNSGHHSMNAGVCSQYELHLRCLLDLPLPKDTRQNRTAIMWNILGGMQGVGKPNYEGLDEVLMLPEVYVHLYGKSTTKPLRKMGHVNILGDSSDEAKNKLAIIKSKLKVTT